MAGNKHKAMVTSCWTSEPAQSLSTYSSSAPTIERSRVSWEDKATGEYYRANHGVQSDGNTYREYVNASKGNKSTGYSARYYAEEKYQIAPQASKAKGSSSSKYLKY